MFRSLYFLLSSLIILAFIIYKIPDLSLPYYWDEAYPYSYAIQHLLANGISMAPDSIPEDYSTGHPLLFYFLEASWMNVFGNTPVSAKSFPLFISVALLFSIFFFCKKFLNELTGFISVLFLCFQSVFIIQSGMVLPEVLLTLLILLSIRAYLSANPFLYILFGSLLMLTKESGIVCIGTLVLIEILKSIKHRSFNFQKLLIVCTPFIAGAAFYIIQKMQMGWYLYPRHFSYVSFDVSKIMKQLIEGGASFIFVFYGRLFLTLMLITAGTFLLYKKTKFSSIEKQTVIVTSAFLFLFLLFSSINFYSPRYVLCCIVFLIIISAFFISKIRTNKTWPAYIITACLCGTFIYYNQLFQFDCDHDPGYYDSVEVQKKAINYCEENNLQDKNIYTLFLMQHYLQTPHLGYLRHPERPFSNVSGTLTDSVSFCIITSAESALASPEIEKRYSLIETFKKGNSWVKIYKPGNTD